MNQTKPLGKRIAIIVTSLLLSFSIGSTLLPQQNVVQSASSKIIAKLNNTRPKQNEKIYLTVTGVKNGDVTVVCHYKSKNTKYTGKVGKKIGIKIGRATKGFKVVVDVKVKSGKKTYYTKTSFTPR